MTLEGRVAIVTGASRGIGEYISKHFAAAGATVVIAARTEEQQDLRLPGTIHSVAQEINDAGGTALAVRTDMRDLESIEHCVERTVEEFGRIDIIVNNAAILVPGGIDSILPRHIELMWQIDLRGPIMLCKYAVPHIKAAGGGHILNISSRAAVPLGPGPYETAGSGFLYGAVKAALERASERLAQELQPDRIACNVLSPMGRIRTPGNIWAEQDPDDPKLEFEPAEEMGKAARWICEQDPAQYTGHILFDAEVCEAQGL